MLKTIFLALLLAVTTLHSAAAIDTLGGPFALTDQAGKRVTDKTYLGKYMLVYFAYTHCSDTCISGIKKMLGAINALGTRASQVQPIIITVDPERDTPQKMAAFVKAISPNLVGLTGTRAEIDDISEKFKVYAMKLPSPTDPNDYGYFQPDFIYVMGPSGSYYSLLQSSYDQDMLARQLDTIIK